MARLFITCRDAHHLLSRRCDARLSWMERMALRLHLRACDWCRIVERNLALLARAVRGLDG